VTIPIVGSVASWPWWLEIKKHGDVFVPPGDGSRDRQRRRGGRLDRDAKDVVAFQHPLADVLVREEGRGVGEVRVAAGVVEVPVRVDDELHRLGRELRERGVDLCRERREL